MWIIQSQKLCFKSVYKEPNLVQFIKIGAPWGTIRELSLKCKFCKIARKRFHGNALVITGYSPKELVINNPQCEASLLSPLKLFMSTVLVLSAFTNPLGNTAILFVHIHPYHRSLFCSEPATGRA